MGKERKHREHKNDKWERHEESSPSRPSALKLVLKVGGSPVPEPRPETPEQPAAAVVAPLRLNMPRAESVAPLRLNIAAISGADAQHKERRHKKKKKKEKEKHKHRKIQRPLRQERRGTEDGASISPGGEDSLLLSSPEAPSQDTASSPEPCGSQGADTEEEEVTTPGSPAAAPPADPLTDPEPAEPPPPAAEPSAVSDQPEAGSSATEAAAGACEAEEPLRQLLTHLLAELRKRDTRSFFALPVTDEVAPGYSSVIDTPMDLSTMATKVAQGQYADLGAFKEDFRLMCCNAMTYNRMDTIYYRSAKRLLHVGSKMMSADQVLALRATLPYMRLLSPEVLGVEPDMLMSPQHGHSAEQEVKQEPEPAAQQAGSTDQPQQAEVTDLPASEVGGHEPRTEGAAAAIAPSADAAGEGTDTAEAKEEPMETEPEPVVEGPEDADAESEAMQGSKRAAEPLVEKIVIRNREKVVMKSADQPEPAPEATTPARGREEAVETVSIVAEKPAEKLVEKLVIKTSSIQEPEQPSPPIGKLVIRTRGMAESERTGDKTQERIVIKARCVQDEKPIKTVEKLVIKTKENLVVSVPETGGTTNPKSTEKKSTNTVAGIEETAQMPEESAPRSNSLHPAPTAPPSTEQPREPAQSGVGSAGEAGLAPPEPSTQPVPQPSVPAEPPPSPAPSPSLRPPPSPVPSTSSERPRTPQTLAARERPRTPQPSAAAAAASPPAAQSILAAALSTPLLRATRRLPEKQKPASPQQQQKLQPPPAPLPQTSQSVQPPATSLPQKKTSPPPPQQRDIPPPPQPQPQPQQRRDPPTQPQPQQVKQQPRPQLQQRGDPPPQQLKQQKQGVDPSPQQQQRASPAPAAPPQSAVTEPASRQQPAPQQQRAEPTSAAAEPAPHQQPLLQHMLQRPAQQTVRIEEPMDTSEDSRGVRSALCLNKARVVLERLASSAVTSSLRRVTRARASLGADRPPAAAPPPAKRPRPEPTPAPPPAAAPQPAPQLQPTPEEVAPPSKLGFLRQREDGTTSLAVVTPSSVDPEARERPVTVGQMAGRLGQGTAHLSGFREDSRNIAKPVKPLYYGAYSSFAPSYDSSFATISREESALLFETLSGGSAPPQLSSVRQVADDCDIAIELVDSLLDVLTSGQHRRAETKLRASEQRAAACAQPPPPPAPPQAQVQGAETADAEPDFRALRSLRTLGIDVGFLDYFEGEERQSRETQARLQQTSELLQSLHAAQQRRLSLPPEAAPPPPSTHELQLAEEVSGGLAALVRRASPGQVASPRGIRKAMGVGALPPQAESETPAGPSRPESPSPPTSLRALLA